jgi:predicted amidophosphoribosyltransferase
MNSPICSSCNSPVPVGAIFCDNCGFDLRSAPAVLPVPTPAGAPYQPPGGAACPGCGANNAAGAQFCENCGAALGIQAPQQQQYPQQPYVQPQGGKMCSSCNFANVDGAQFCENCGNPLASATPMPQQFPAPPPPVQQHYAAPPIPQAPLAPPQQVAFGGAVTGRLVLQSSNAQLNFPQNKSEVTIGREDPVSSLFPDINLDPYGGFDAGVSRLHAKLMFQNGRLVLIDLNAANGTFVNKQKMSPNSPHPINNGDELRFGQLIVMYYSS